MTNAAPRFLVADDDKELREMMLMILNLRLKIPSSQIDVAHDGIEASDFAAENNYTVVFTDNTMPGKTGLELIREIRSNPKITQPKIIMSSGDGGEIRQYAMDAGADVFLAKPYVIKDLTDAYYLVRGDEAPLATLTPAAPTQTNASTPEDPSP